MSSTKQLLADIEAFLSRTGMHETTLGKLVRNDSKMLTSLRAGSSVTLDTADRIRAVMADHDVKSRRRRRPHPEAAA